MKHYLVRIPQGNGVGADVFEDVFSQLHETLQGQTFSCEIVATAQNIGFCFSADEATCELIASQIYSVAPRADVVQIIDRLSRVKEKKGIRVQAIEVGLNRDRLLPLKDYRDFKRDSLLPVLGVLSKCRQGEEVVVQIVARPERETAPVRLKREIHKGIDRILHAFKIRYWFKREAGKQLLEKLSEKSRDKLFKANIRVVVMSSRENVNPDLRLKAIFGGLSSFNTLHYNQFEIDREYRNERCMPLFQNRTLRHPYLLSAREIASLYHLPSGDEIPNMMHVLSARQAPPGELPTDTDDKSISFFGVTNFRDEHIPFGIKRTDRRRHLYCIGKSGSGKSKLLELLIKNDIDAGHGVGVLDPHGDLVDNVLRLIPKHRVRDVVVFDPTDLAFPPSFNPLDQVPEGFKIRVTLCYIEIFKKIFAESWSPRIEYVVRYTTLALLDTPGTTVLSILRMLTDADYRDMVVSNIRDSVVRDFWVRDFESWSRQYDGEAIAPLVNKVGQFVATNMMRNVLGQPINRFDFRSLMDNRKILLMKVSKGILGEETAQLLGAITVAKVYQAAMSRADVYEEERPDFYFYVDEFHNFATESFEEILSEARKYHVNLTLANQFLSQLSSSMRDTIFGNVGSLISFRVGAEDASLVADEFRPRFTERDLRNLAVREFCLKMSIDGKVKEAFSGRTLDIPRSEHNHSCDAIEHSRRHFARPVAEVEEVLRSWEKSAPTSAAVRPAVGQ